MSLGISLSIRIGVTFSPGGGAPANSAPSIAIGDKAYAENDGAVVLDAAMTVADADDEIESLTGQFDTVPDGNAEEFVIAGVTIPLGEDLAATEGTAGTTTVEVSYDFDTLKWTVVKQGGGKWPPGDAQTAGREATYAHTSDNPTEGARVLTWTVDDGTDTAQDTGTITVTAVDDDVVLMSIIAMDGPFNFMGLHDDVSSSQALKLMAHCYAGSLS